MSRRQKQTNTYPLRLPSSMKAAVREVSRRDGTSINQFVTTAVAEKLSAMRTADFFAEREAEADIERARNDLNLYQCSICPNVHRTHFCNRGYLLFYRRQPPHPQTCIRCLRYHVQSQHGE